MDQYDVIIIGGGSSGLMAGIAAGKRGAKVLLLEKGGKPGLKLGISGGGRCNVTNNKDIDRLIQNIPGNGRFLYSSLQQFSSRDIIRFFEGLGIALKEEDNGRMFPVTDKAKTVVDALIREVRNLGVTVRVQAPVEKVMYRGDEVFGVKLKTGETIHSKSVVVAVGGKSVPRTGSTGDGYGWAEEAGHTITSLFPTEVPITSKEPFIVSRELQGLSLRNVTLTVLDAKGKRIVAHRGDLLITHFGLSGPIALRCSQFVVKQLAKGFTDVLLAVDFFPDRPADDIYEQLTQLTQTEPKKAAVNGFKRLCPERILPVLLHAAGIGTHTPCGTISRASLREFTDLLKRFPLRADGTLSIEEAFVTGGGVHLKEIDPKTMQSKLKKGLYFCGEILDIHGYTGGYNITAAFSTGHAAGDNAARYALMTNESRE